MKSLNKEEKQALHIVAEYQKAESYEWDQHPGTSAKVSQPTPDQLPERAIAPVKEESEEKSKQQTKSDKVQAKNPDQKKNESNGQRKNGGKPLA